LCPSIDAANRIRNYVPDARIVVTPHEEEVYRYQRTIRISPVRTGESLRVAVLGVLSEQKGGNLLLDCVEVANEMGASIRWEIIGYFQTQTLRARAKQLAQFLNNVTGPYSADKIKQLIEQAAPHVLLFPQRWPETYSFTLSEALQSGYPILAPDIGSFTERLVGLAGCCLYRLESSPRDLVEKLISIHQNYLTKGRPFDDEVAILAVPTEISPGVKFYPDEYLRPIGTTS
jgi:glycosyltransferase involved in cell wall biosynthesis